MSYVLIEWCKIIKCNDGIVRNEILYLIIAIHIMIRNKVIKIMRNEKMLCTRSTTDGSNDMIKYLKENG